MTDAARRALAEVRFAGMDITKPLKECMLSIEYTDNEEGQADDLQIRIADREGAWLTRWLGDAVQKAIDSPGPPASGRTYKVTAKSGLNVRKGPGTKHGKLGALAYGASIEVSSIANNWASITYSGKSAYVSAKYIEKVSATSGKSQAPGFLIQAVFVQQNWQGDGKDKTLDCGQFELDAVTADGPPSVISIKATSLPYGAQIRQTKKSRAWEAYRLSGIAAEIAAAAGMSCLYESTGNPYYARLEQSKTSDIAFLSKLCRDAGISLKVTNNIIVLFDQAAYEGKPPVLAIRRGDGQYLKYTMYTGKADTKYDSCLVRYTDPATGRKIEGEAFADGEEKKEDGQQLRVTAKVSSIAEAKALAEKRLRAHNKYGLTARFTLPGNPDLVAGVTLSISGWGLWDGKYITSQAQHTLGSSGYTTKIEIRRVLEGY